MTVEEYNQRHNELHDRIRNIAFEKERLISAINSALNERIRVAKEWAAMERRKVSDEAYEQRMKVRSELTLLHYEFHSVENQ